VVFDNGQLVERDTVDGPGCDAHGAGQHGRLGVLKGVDNWWGREGGRATSFDTADRKE
jgi:hypothetical protein